MESGYGGSRYMICAIVGTCVMGIGAGICWIGFFVSLWNVLLRGEDSWEETTNLEGWFLFALGFTLFGAMAWLSTSEF